MSRRRRKRDEYDMAANLSEILDSAQPSNPIVIIGAGMFIGDIIDLIHDTPGFDLAGILDPSPSLKEQCIKGIPVLGWLNDLPSGKINAAIALPATPGGFERSAVFHMLLQREIPLPVMWSAESTVAQGISLEHGTIILPGAKIEAGAAVGAGCILGPNCCIQHNVELTAHTVVMTGECISRSLTSKRPAIQPKSLEATMVSENESLRDVVRKINWAGMEILLVINSAGELVGTITDGDIRRGILAGIDFAEPASVIMNPNPRTVPLGTHHARLLEIMRAESIRHLPVIDTKGHPVRLDVMENLVDDLRHTDAVVMAGGLGTRLMPLTESTPKPLLSVGDRPILDHIMTGLRKSGFHDVIVSVNHMADQIKNHLGEGKRHDLNIEYLSEKHRLGTAGALSLLRPRPTRPFLVMNGDLLTDMDFSRVLRFQEEDGYSVVMCVRKYEFKVPYGVVNIDNQQIVGLEEKPTCEYFINAGIYALAPSCLELIPPDRFFNMTDLVNAVIADGGSVGAFPILAYWRDIGTPEDLNAARSEKNANRAALSLSREKITA